MRAATRKTVKPKRPAMSDEERQLWADYHADRSDLNRNRLAEFHHGLVIYQAGKRYETLAPNAMIFLDDLVTYGTLGLFGAIRGFHPDRGLKFVTYANPRIWGAMQDGIRQMDWLRPIRRSPSWKSGHPQQISISSRDRENDDSGRDYNPIKDLMVSYDLDRLELRDQVKRALAGLSKVERIIVIEYHAHGRRMKDIAHDIGMSESRVSQMMKDILQRIRARFPNGIDAA